MCPATHLRPGVVQAHSAPVSGLLDLGRFPVGLATTVQAIADAIATTTFQSVARPDIMRWKYRKLLMNLANAVEALAGPEGRFGPLAREAQREGKEVLAAAGIAVATLGGGPGAAGRPPADGAPRPRGSGRGLQLAEPGPRHGVHRGGVPQRRDRPAGRPPRRGHAGQRAAAAPGRPGRRRGRRRRDLEHRGAQRAGGRPTAPERAAASIRRVGPWPALSRRGARRGPRRPGRAGGSPACRRGPSAPSRRSGPAARSGRTRGSRCPSPRRRPAPPCWTASGSMPSTAVSSTSAAVDAQRPCGPGRRPRRRRRRR